MMACADGMRVISRGVVILGLVFYAAFVVVLRIGESLRAQYTSAKAAALGCPMQIILRVFLPVTRVDVFGL